MALDLAEVPADALRRLPFTTWLRLQRMVEGSQTVALLVGHSPIARSPGGLTLALNGSAPTRSSLPRMVGAERGAPAGAPGDAVGSLLAGLDISSRIIRARVRAGADQPPSVRTRVHAYV